MLWAEGQQVKVTCPCPIFRAVVPIRLPGPWPWDDLCPTGSPQDLFHATTQVRNQLWNRKTPEWTLPKHGHPGVGSYEGFPPGGTSGKEKKTPPANAGDVRDGGSIPWWGRSPPRRRGTATHSSILAWRIPWTEEPGRLQSTGKQRVGHD